MTSIVTEERMLRELRNDVSACLERVGLLARVFGRFKSPESISEKIPRKGYSMSGRLMQDLIGMRVAVYFLDDLIIVRDILESHFGTPVEEVRDEPSHTTFQPIRWNLVFRLPTRLTAEVMHIIGDRPIDTTFEIQLRTVLAEGWHEVEHDLRYKRPGDWDTEPDMSRIFNGLLASLENADWTMLQLFEKFAYQKYKTREWEAMIRMKYRLRLSGELDANVLSILNDNTEIAKTFFRVRRNSAMRHLQSLGDDLPLTVSNFVFLVNRISSKEERLTRLEPRPVSRILDRLRHEQQSDLAVSGSFDVQGPVPD